MELTNYDYLFIWILSIILILLFFIDINRMIKIIISNYIIIVIALWIELWFQIMSDILIQNQQLFIQSLWNIEELTILIKSNDTAIILIIYLIILILIFTRSKISIWLTQNKFAGFTFKLIFAPLTIINFITTMLLIRHWDMILSKNILYQYANSFHNNILIYYMILLTPLWLIIPWLITILFSFDYSFFKKWASSNWGMKKFSIFWKSKQQDPNLGHGWHETTHTEQIIK